MGEAKSLEKITCGDGGSTCLHVKKKTGKSQASHVNLTRCDFLLD